LARLGFNLSLESDLPLRRIVSRPETQNVRLKKNWLRIKILDGVFDLELHLVLG
jgi:hypothetical protein